MKANYFHDCNVCVFLGTDELDNEPVDMYARPQLKSATKKIFDCNALLLIVK